MRNKIVNRANSIIGMSRDEVNCSGTHAWCAQCVSEVLRWCGINNMYDLSCNALYKKMSASPEWDEPNDYPIPADFIFFDWNDPSNPDFDEATLPLDHVGIVVDFNESTGMITYVNGNGSSSTHVTKQSISVHSRYVSYWMRYIGDKKPVEDKSGSEKKCSVELPVLRTGTKNSDAVLALQVLLTKKFNIDLPKYGCDSDFGAETHSAVHKFQKSVNLLEDGIVGKDTWTALLCK